MPIVKIVEFFPYIDNLCVQVILWLSSHIQRIFLQFQTSSVFFYVIISILFHGRKIASRKVDANLHVRPLSRSLPMFQQTHREDFHIF